MTTKRKRNREKLIRQSTHQTIVANGGAIPERWLSSSKELGELTLCGTMGAVIKALGGPPKVAKLTGHKYNHVHNWINDTGRFPAKTHPVMQRALAKAGYIAPGALWGIIEP
jgi:hypothetical protein